MRPLSNSEMHVQRSFEKALYDVLLKNGYIPDRKVVGSDPVKPEYVAAAGVIKNAKGFCVALYGHGEPHAKDNLSVPRIVVTGLGFMPGDTGNEFGPTYELNGVGKYDKYTQTPPFSNYRIQVELVSNKTSQDRLIESVRQSALPNISFISKWDEPDFKYLIEYAFTSQRGNLEYGLINKLYTYEVKDVPEAYGNQEEVANGGISKIKQIEVFDEQDNNQLLVKVRSTSMETVMFSMTYFKIN